MVLSKVGGKTESGEVPREGERRIPATERVLDHILAEMDAGRLVPGGRVNAARIAAALQLSAAPVREALSVLSGRGVLELLPDRGAIIRPMTPDEVCDLWRVLESISSVGVSLAARAIAEGADPAPLIERFNLIREGAGNVPPIELLLRLNAWHFAANEIGGNPYVSMALERLGTPYWDRYLADLIDVQGNIDGYVGNYRRMHEAVLAGDGAAAAVIMRFHAEWSIGLVRDAEARMVKGRRKRRSSSAA